MPMQYRLALRDEAFGWRLDGGSFNDLGDAMAAAIRKGPQVPVVAMQVDHRPAAVYNFDYSRTSELLDALEAAGDIEY